MEYFIGSITDVRITRENVTFGMNLENPVYKWYEVNNRSIQTDEVYVSQEYNSMRPHKIALQDMLTEQANTRLKNGAVSKNNGMKKFGKYPTHIRCKLSRKDNDDNVGISYNDLYKLDDGYKWAIIECTHDQHYTYTVQRARILDDYLEAYNLLTLGYKALHDQRNPPQGSLSHFINDYKTGKRAIIVRDTLFHCLKTTE